MQAHQLRFKSVVSRLLPCLSRRSLVYKAFPTATNLVYKQGPQSFAFKFQKKAFNHKIYYSTMEADKQASSDGSFKRQDAQYRHTIKPDSEFEADKDRYILYAMYGCPWATRTLIVRSLKQLEPFIDIVICVPKLTPNGWPIDDKFPNCNKDPVFNAANTKEIYLHDNNSYTGKYSIPILFDKKTKKIVNNESAEIIEIFNTSFNDLLRKTGNVKAAEIDLYPESLKKDIDEFNDYIYENFNNGVYKTGFAGNQENYEKNFKIVFEALDFAEKKLQDKKFVVGDQMTLADIRLFVTAIRFDVSYYSVFDCDKTMIRTGYPNVLRWMQSLYKLPAFQDNTNFPHIKYSYTGLRRNNISPIGPVPSIPGFEENPDNKVDADFFLNK